MALFDGVGSTARRGNVYSPGGGSGAPTYTPVGGGLSTGGRRVPLLGSPARPMDTIGDPRGLLSVEPGTRAAQMQLSAMATHTNRPSGFLNIVSRALSFPVNLAAGFWKGFTESIEKADKEGHGWSPVETFIALGHGFAEIPEAVGQNLTFTELVKERNDPDSWLYHHAKLVGLTMDITLDPTTYLSFGATTASKTAARTAWASSWHSSLTEAKKAIADGEELLVNGTKVNARDLGYTQTALLKHYEALRPFTLGDTLKQLHDIDFMQGNLRTMGAGGIRFAGQELPGTPQVAEWLTRRFQGSLSSKPHVAIEDLMQYNGGDLIPKDLSDIVMRDVMETLSKTTMRSFIENSMKDTKQVFNAQLRDINRVSMEAAKKSMEVQGKVVPLEVRQHAMRALSGRQSGLSGTPFNVKPQASSIVSGIKKAKAGIEAEAKKFGVDDKQLTNWWQEATRNPRFRNDPSMALYEFQWKAMTEMTKRKFMDELLDNPLFATKIRKEEYSAFSSDLDKRFLPTGYESLNHRGQLYAVRTEIKDAIDKFRNPAVMNEEMKKVFRIAGGAQQIWKIPATVMNPSFHVMNAVGGVWNNMLQAISNPMDYTRALGLMYRVWKDERKGLNEMSSQNIKDFMEFQRQGGLGRGNQIMGDLEGITSSIKELQRGDMPALERMFHRAPGETKTQFGVRKAASLTMIPAIIAGGKKVGSGIEDMLRLTPAMKWSKDPTIAGWFDHYSAGYIRTHAGMDHWDEATKEAMVRIGANLSKQFQFDYLELPEWERAIKTIFPFWVYHKNNLILQSRELLKQPRYISTALKVANYSQEHQGQLGPLEAFLPEYFDTLGAFEIPVPKFMRKELGLGDQPLFLNPKLPFHAAFAFYPPLWDLFRDTGENTAQKFGRIFSGVGGAWGPFSGPIPGAKLAIEAWANRSFGLGRPIDFQRAGSTDWRNSFVTPPAWVKFLPKALRDHMGIFESPSGGLKMQATWKYVMDALSSPFVSNLGKSLPMEGDRPGWQADLFSWMSGIRLMPVDMLRLQRAWGYQAINSLEGRQGEAREKGADLPPDEKLMLHDLRYYMKIIEGAYDAQTTPE